MKKIKIITIGTNRTRVFRQTAFNHHLQKLRDRVSKYFFVLIKNMGLECLRLTAILHFTGGIWIPGIPTQNPDTKVQISIIGFGMVQYHRVIVLLKNIFNNVIFTLFEVEFWMVWMTGTKELAIKRLFDYWAKRPFNNFKWWFFKGNGIVVTLQPVCW